MFTSAVNGTTDTHKFGCTSCEPLPYRMFTRSDADEMTDWIGQPAIDPVLSSTSDSSRPVAWLSAVALALTVIVVNPSTPMIAVGSVAVLVIITVEADGSVTTGTAAVAPR